MSPNNGATPKLVTGAKAESRAGFAQNVRREKDLGKSDKRAEGVAYGESYLGIDKMERDDRRKK
tara:strand:- start:503 stop:694 length:192 start_codon:yes stop_codon:yes gene_type:complete